MQNTQWLLASLALSCGGAAIERGLGHREVRTSTSNRRIIIAKDPAGNGMEISSR